jgi:hypothetical protein
MVSRWLLCREQADDSRSHLLQRVLIAWAQRHVSVANAATLSIAVTACKNRPCIIVRPQRRTSHGARIMGRDLIHSGLVLSKSPTTATFDTGDFLTAVQLARTVCVAQTHREACGKSLKSKGLQCRGRAMISSATVRAAHLCLRKSPTLRPGGVTSRAVTSTCGVCQRRNECDTDATLSRVHFVRQGVLPGLARRCNSRPTRRIATSATPGMRPDLCCSPFRRPDRCDTRPLLN